MNNFNSGSGILSKEAADFEDTVHDHLKNIFPLVSRNVQYKQHNYSFTTDFEIKSQNSRLLLFEARYVKNENKLPRSIYLSMAAYKEKVYQILSEQSPILAVISNAQVDEQTAKIFGKSGIPVLNIGETHSQTLQNLKKAFDYLAIIVPGINEDQEIELEFNSNKFKRCYLSIPYNLSNSNLIFEEGIKKTLLRTNYVIVNNNYFTDPFILENVTDLIRSADIYIADITDSHLNTYFEAGIAKGLGKEIILISQNRNQNLSISLSSSSFIYYENTVTGIKHLSEVLKERLISLNYRDR